MYFISYTTNKLELPQEGWNVWRVIPNKRQKGNALSFMIIDIIVGGKRRPQAKNVIASQYQIADNERSVFVKLFSLGDK